MDPVAYTILAMGVGVFYLAHLGISLYFLLRPPTEINGYYGYRTPRSMKNPDNWRFANRLGSRIMFASACVAAVLSGLILLVGKQHLSQAWLLSLLGVIAFLSPLLTIPIVEIKLSIFDREQQHHQN